MSARPAGFSYQRWAAILLTEAVAEGHCTQGAILRATLPKMPANRPDLDLVAFAAAGAPCANTACRMLDDLEALQ